MTQTRLPPNLCRACAKALNTVRPVLSKSNGMISSPDAAATVAKLNGFSRAGQPPANILIEPI
jgi:hypothetical protein